VANRDDFGKQMKHRKGKADPLGDIAFQVPPRRRSGSFWQASVWSRRTSTS